MTESMSVNITNLREVVSYLDSMPAQTSVQAKAAFTGAATRADAQIKDNATNILKVRTGTLRRSINMEVKGTDLKSLKASVFSKSIVGGSEVVYAPIHEYGGTITATDKYMGVPGGPYLNIPTSQNKTAAGVTRLQAREVFNAGGYIGGRTVFNAEGTPMFWLTKSVTIKPRLGMVDAANDEVPTLLSDLAAIIGDE